MKQEIKKLIENSIEVKKLLLNPECINKILKIAEEIILSFKNNGKVIIFGNGGSAADAQHMVCELVGRFKKERKPLPAISLTVNTSNITAISNDYSYDEIFKRQLEALASVNDIAIAISTSGNASNVIEAAKQARKMKLKIIALTGKDGGKLSRVADISLIVPSGDIPRIQEAHILIIHILCELIENAIEKQ
ncbi:MAG: SIS domain-containing protein [Candidatus Omnitrophica bacterium]|nr:SIS domain-containing protein [Candidatus Omnitrophota bacterium]